jgi:hypothetical protein
LSFLYFKFNKVGVVTRLELKVFEIVFIFLKAVDSFKESKPIVVKFKKFSSFLLSNGNSKRCAGVRVASSDLFW